MRVCVRETEGDDICAGAQAGRQLLVKLLTETTAEPVEPTPLFVDFAGIEIATASFLRESVLALQEFLRGRKSNFYPILANVNKEIVDELDVILPLRNEVFLICELQSDQTVSSVKLLGRLEERQRRIFSFIENRGETDAGELQQEFGTAEGVQQTAWNNRLSALANTGIVAEISRGRSKRYRSLLQGG